MFGHFGFSQNFFYQPGDWYIVSNPGRITSFTESNYTIFIGAENGVYYVDKYNGEFGYDYEISSKIESNNVKFIQYHPISDHIWIITKTDIYFKSLNSSIWRELSLFDVGLNSIYQIDDVGISPEYIWFKSAGVKVPINPFNGSLITDIDIHEEDFIEWGYSYYGEEHKSIDLTKFSMHNGWNTHFNTITYRNEQTYYATIMFEDKNQVIWIGTENGNLFKTRQNRRNLKLFKTGPHTNNLSTSFLDENGMWWFADSEFLRTGNNRNIFNIYNNSDYFLSFWNEEKNIWKYYSLSESTHILNSDVLAINRSSSNVYLATMYGILVLDLVENNWSIIEQNDGLHDQAVWDMVVVNNSLYCATSRGINEISTINNAVIPHDMDLLSQFDKTEIYDIEKNNESILVASQNGLFKMNLSKNLFTKLSDKAFRTIQFSNGKIYGLSNKALYEITSDKDDLIAQNVSCFSVNGKYLWTFENPETVLYNFETGDRHYYDEDDGIPGDRVYKIDSDKEWVWFMSNNGFALYNWSRYHAQ
jgi:hypothetical protein